MLFNRRPRVFFNTDDAGSVTPPPAAVPTPEPVAPPAPAAPWAADATAYFGDNAEAIAGFDRYMREKQQPYITQLESSTADARELWTDLNADPASTARDLIASIYSDNPDVVAAYDAIFAEETAPPAAVEPDEIPEWAKPLVESHQEKVDRELREANAAGYEAAKTELRTAHPDLTDADMPLIDTFVAMPQIGGDMEAAYAAFTTYKQQFLAANGVVPTPPPTVPTPPPVLGTDGVAATPPLATQYKTYNQVGDALKSYFAREGAASNPPPVVG